MKPTPMTIQLADRSIKFPLGIVENMHVLVGRFTILVDFVIMDIKEDRMRLHELSLLLEVDSQSVFFTKEKIIK